jgi:alpha 1,3-mannosyltransferase
MEGRNPSEEMKESKFWTQLGSREELESGVVVYDKSRRDVLMGLMTVAWMNTKRVREEVTYKLTCVFMSLQLILHILILEQIW